jgi:hypothetical protein
MLVDLSQAYMVLPEGPDHSYRLYKIVRLESGMLRWTRVERADLTDFVMFALQHDLGYKKRIDFGDRAGGIYVPNPGVVLRRTAEKRMVVQGPEQEVKSMIDALKQRGLKRWREVDVHVDSALEDPSEGTVAFETSWQRANTPFEFLLPSIGESWPAPMNEPEWRFGQAIKYIYKPIQGPSRWEEPKATEIDATVVYYGVDKIGRIVLRIRFVNENGNPKEVVLYGSDFAKVRPV